MGELSRKWRGLEAKSGGHRKEMSDASILETEQDQEAGKVQGAEETSATSLKNERGQGAGQGAADEDGLKSNFWG